LVNDVEEMPWTAVAFTQGISRAGFQVANGLDAAGTELSSRLDDFSVRYLTQ
jgi:hypothetical protein